LCRPAGPKNAVGFAVHGAALRLLTGAASTAEAKRNGGLATVALAGCFAGAAQCFVVVPADRIKCQLQVQGIGVAGGAGRAAVMEGGGGGPAVRGVGLKDCVSQLVHQDGWRAGLFRGWWPTFWRQTPSAVVYFGSYEAMTRLSRHVAPDGSTMLTMISGGLAGVAAYTSTYPFDIIKNYAHAGAHSVAICLHCSGFGPSARSCQRGSHFSARVCSAAAPPGTPAAEVGMLQVMRLMRKQYGPVGLIGCVRALPSPLSTPTHEHVQL
jgi:hypothetical protein